MSSTRESADAAARREVTADRSPVGTLGRWLGPLAFAAFLWCTPPESARDAAREALGRDLEPQTLAALAHEAGVAPPDSPAWRAAEERVVTRRAEQIMAAAGVTAWVAIWWITVAVPIPVTALLPIVLLPLTGVMSETAAAAPYANPNVFLFLGGFLIALAVERCGLHRRIALRVVSHLGTGRRGLVLGFMIATAGLSMWISNTATALIMLPIGLAVIRSLEQFEGDRDANFSCALMLGIAYAASIGGMGTPIGTPPNLVLRGQWDTLYPDRPEFGFGPWMLACLPLVGVLLAAAWLVLVGITCPPRRGGVSAGKAAIREQLASLGPLRWSERLTFAVFAATGLLWATRSIPVGGGDYGWASLLETLLTPAEPRAAYFRAADLQDATIAIAMAALLFLLPGDRGPDGRRAPLLDWETAERVPFGILLLFGGGFSIAAALQTTGVSLWCGQALTALPLTNSLALLAATCLLVTFLTEITSNTASTQILLPIMGPAALAIGGSPLELMLATTLSASCAFMLPVATPPNAIVFGSGCVPLRKMIWSGLLLNLVGVVLVTVVVRWLAGPLLG